MSNRSIQGPFSYAHCTFQDNFISAVSIYLAKFRVWKLQLGHCKIQLYFNILPLQNFKKIFSKVTHSPKMSKRCFTWQYEYGRLPCRYIIYICVRRTNWGIHDAAWECFSNWETIVTQIEKKIETQSSFIKDLEVLKTETRISKSIS